MMNEVMSASESSCAPNSLVTCQCRASEPSHESSSTHTNRPQAASALWPVPATISDSTPIMRLNEVNPLTIRNRNRGILKGGVLLNGVVLCVARPSPRHKPMAHCTTLCNTQFVTFCRFFFHHAG